ncbi:hypothetical protein Tco_0379450 [Tanacetum coccineum]
MANLEFCDKHNMVAYLLKSEGSEGFHQIIDFLTASHIKYALLENPTIYVSFIKQFWRTSTASTTANGEVELTARIDGQEKTITEASLRRHLKLEDNDGITTLPNTEIFEQLALIGYVTDSDKLTFQKEEPALMSHESSLQSVHSLGRDEGSLSLNELTVLCTTLSKKVEHLQNDLKQTKLTYGAAYTKLILRVKKLEKQVKTSKARRRVRLVLSEDEDAAEDSSKQGRKISEIDRDPTISLILLDVEEPTELVEDQGSGEKGEKEVSTVGEELSTVIPEVSTAAANLVYIRRSAEKRKDKGKIIMTELEPEQTTIKLKLRQERAGLEAAIRLQEQLNEEESQRIARDAEIARQLQEEINIAGQEKVVAEDDQSHDINWNDHSVIRFYAQQNRPFSKDEDQVNAFIPKYSEIEKVVMKRPGFDLQQDNSKRQKTGERSVSIKEPKDKELVEPSQKEIQEMMIILPEEGMHVEVLQTKYPLIDWEIHSEDTMKFWKIIRVGNYTEVYHTFADMLKNFDRYNLVKLWELIKERFNTTEPIDDKERKLLVELKRLFEPDTNDLMELQSHMHDPLTWRLYDTCGVHHVSTKTGLDMFMLVEKDYPLTTGLPILMLVNKLQVDYDSKMVNELLRKIFILANKPRQ